MVKLLKKCEISALQDSSVEVLGDIRVPYGGQTMTAPVIKFKLRTSYVPGSSLALLSSRHRAVSSTTLIFLSHLNIFDSYLSLSSTYKRTLFFEYRVMGADSHLPFVCSLTGKRYMNGASDWFRKYDGHSVLAKHFLFLLLSYEIYYTNCTLNN
jgi:hypothetical protein